MTNHDLADWTMVEELIERTGTRTPAYADEVIAATARVRQRPAWTFAGRWLPAATWSRVPRPGVVVALLALALLAGLLVWAGSRPAPTDPLGGNGLIAVSVCDQEHEGYGVITVDPASGRLASSGSPSWHGSVLGFSPDGTRLAYLVPERGAGEGPVCHAPEVGRLVVGAADGTGAVQLTGDLRKVTGASWSPDGSRIAVSFSDDANRTSIAVVATDGSGIRVLDLGGPADSATWQPDGNLILFRGQREGHNAIFTFAADDPTDIRPVAGVDTVASESGVQPEAAWSPDGQRIAYVRRASPGGSTTSLHVVDVDGARDHVLPVSSHEGYPMRPRWSPDGTLILAMALTQLVVAAADGSEAAKIGPPSTDGNIGITDFTWSPDGRMVAAGPHYEGVATDADGSTRSVGEPLIVLIDVATNTWTTLDPGSDLPVLLVGGAALSWQAVR